MFTFIGHKLSLSESVLKLYHFIDPVLIEHTTRRTETMPQVLKETNLFKPITIGSNVQLQNRAVMPPLTRTRSQPDIHVKDLTKNNTPFESASDGVYLEKESEQLAKELNNPLPSLTN